MEKSYIFYRVNKLSKRFKPTKEEIESEFKKWLKKQIKKHGVTIKSKGVPS
jgi:hypothetical protein